MQPIEYVLSILPFTTSSRCILILAAMKLCKNTQNVTRASLVSLRYLLDRIVAKGRNKNA